MSQTTAELDQLKQKILRIDERMRNNILGPNKQNISRNERMEIYNQIYNLIEAKKEESLWKRNCQYFFDFYLELEDSMISHYKERLNQLHDYAFLEYFDKFWSSIRLYTQWNLTIFSTINNYAKLYKNKTLLQCTLEMLRSVINQYNEKLTTGLLKELQNDRSGSECSTQLIGNLFKAYFEVDYEERSKIEKIGDSFFYVFDETQGLRHDMEGQQVKKQKTSTFCTLIKERLLNETKEFYSKKVQEWLGLTVPDFLDTANKYLNQEQERIDLYYPYERTDIWNCITDQVIVKTANSIVSNNETGLLHLLMEKKAKYVTILYDFLDKINHPLENMTAHVLDYIQKIIENIKNKTGEDEKEQDSQQIDEIIEFKQEIMKTCNECFKKNKAIINSVKLELQRAFAKVDDFPKKLAGYVDEFILKNGKNLENEEVSLQVNEIFDIVSLTTERDKFLYFYEQALKSRLLSINNYNEGIENEFLKRLNQVMGEQQIIRIKGMIQDIVNSKKLNNDMATFIGQRKAKYGQIKPEVFNIYLLTKSSWPKEVLETETCQIPEDLGEYVNGFNDYFENQNPGQTKVVDWLLEEGSVEVTTNIGPKKTKMVFILSVAQYSIIQAMSNTPGMKMSLGEIKEVTKVKKIVGAIGPLVGKKLLTRESSDIKAKIEDTEFLSINQNFQSKTREVNFVVRKTLKTRTTEGDKEKIDDMRKMMIEAAVVKNMKSKKVSKFQELAAEVRKLLQDHFQPPDNLLRIMIDDLIRREFLERDENDMNVYKYKA